MLDLRPADVPGVRDALRKLWSSEYGLYFAHADTRRSSGPAPQAATYVRSQLLLLERAGLYWVSPDMCQVLRRAANSLPSTQLQPEDLPAEAGVVAFAVPLVATDTDVADFQLQVGIMEWGRASIAGTDCLHLGFYGDTQEVVDRTGHTDLRDAVGRWYYQGASAWPFGVATEDTSAWPDATEQAKASYIEDRQLIQTFFLFLTQKVPYVTDHVPTRAELRRYQRKNLPVPSVRVVDVRRQKPSSSGDEEPTHVDWSHRWMVDGHWRRQWHPSTQRHVPTYIAPHVKGPADKPLVIKEQVRAVR